MACEQPNRQKQIKQWLWFIGLWVGGVCAMSVLAYAIKGLIYFMR